MGKQSWICAGVNILRLDRVKPIEQQAQIVREETRRVQDRML